MSWTCPTPIALIHFADESIEAHVLTEPLFVVAVVVPLCVTISTCMEAPFAIRITFFTAPASINARTVFSFTGVAPEKALLFRDGDAGTLAMFDNQLLYHVGDRTMISPGGHAEGFLEVRIDANVEGSGFKRGHSSSPIIKPKSIAIV